ncbi:hypothetical protein G6F68_016041 [Rhizopus microsporus]|nr:hypothetical protein G6F68_016041 [Rhizopus microsporus]
MLVSAILSGHLPPGMPVPSSRQLADQLHIARNTVVFAYQQLVSEGYLVSRERSGHFVCDSVMQGHSGSAADAAHAAPPDTVPDPQRTGRSSPTPSCTASSTLTSFPPPNGASAASRPCPCWTSAAGRPTSSRTMIRR